jgi:cytochrome c oxidase subunit 2
MKITRRSLFSVLPNRRYRAPGALVMLGIVASLHPHAARAAGSQWYPLCGSCHGEHGEGLDAFDAPRLQGLSPVYLARQLDNFRRSRRGQAPGDTLGQQMVSMATLLPDDAAVLEVARHASSLPPSASTTRREAGKPLPPAFGTCAACHGAAGEGSDALQAPRLAGQRAAYLLRQFRHFKSGLRGADPGDVPGARMLAMARAVRDDATLAELMQALESSDPPPATSNEHPQP